jgi:hypothetical protein
VKASAVGALPVLPDLGALFPAKPQLPDLHLDDAQRQLSAAVDVAVQQARDLLRQAKVHGFGAAGQGAPRAASVHGGAGGARGGAGGAAAADLSAWLDGSVLLDAVADIGKKVDSARANAAAAVLGKIDTVTSGLANTTAKVEAHVRAAAAKLDAGMHHGKAPHADIAAASAGEMPGAAADATGPKAVSGPSSRRGGFGGLFSSIKKRVFGGKAPPAKLDEKGTSTVKVASVPTLPMLPTLPSMPTLFKPDITAAMVVPVALETEAEAPFASQEAFESGVVLPSKMEAKEADDVDAFDAFDSPPADKSHGDAELSAASLAPNMAAEPAEPMVPAEPRVPSPEQATPAATAALLAAVPALAKPAASGAPSVPEGKAAAGKAAAKGAGGQTAAGLVPSAKGFKPAIPLPLAKAAAPTSATQAKAQAAVRSKAPTKAGAGPAAVPQPGVPAAKQGGNNGWRNGTVLGEAGPAHLAAPGEVALPCATLPSGGPRQACWNAFALRRQAEQGDSGCVHGPPKEQQKCINAWAIGQQRRLGAVPDCGSSPREFRQACINSWLEHGIRAAAAKRAAAKMADRLSGHASPGNVFGLYMSSGVAATLADAPLSKPVEF